MPVSQTIGTISTAPQLGVDSKEDFVTKAETVWGELKDRVPELNTAFGQLNALEANVNAKEASAVAAAELAAAAANASMWVSGGTYTAGQSVWSLINFKTYRAKTDHSGITTDPSLDTTNWALLVDILPDQTGNAGKFLKTDGTDASWDTVASLGSGGATTAVPATLTNASPSMHKLTATTFGQSITLPDATTMASTGVNIFGLYNSSQYVITIKDSAGTIMGFIDPSTQVNVSLFDNTTATGGWELSGHKWASKVTEVTILGASSNAASYTRVCEVSAGVYLCVYAKGTANISAFVYDSINGVVGAETVVRTENIQIYHNVVKAADGVALVVSCTNSLTAMQGVALTVTGTTISVGTASSYTLGGSINSTANNTKTPISLKQVGSSFVAGYARATTVAEIVAITVTGATVAFGAVSAQTGTGVCPVIVPTTTNNALIVSQVSSGNITIKPISVAGTTISNGTSTSLTTTTTGFNWELLDSGRLAIIYTNSSNIPTGAIISVSGTTASNTTVALGTENGGFYNYLKVGNQVIVASGGGTADPSTINVLTDNAGTAVAGTDIGANIICSSNMLYLGSHGGSLFVVNQETSSIVSVLKVGINGNDPTIEFIGKNQTSTTKNDYSLPSGRRGTYGDQYGQATIKGSSAEVFIRASHTASKQLCLINGNVSVIDSITVPVNAADFINYGGDVLCVAPSPDYKHSILMHYKAV